MHEGLISVIAGRSWQSEEVPGDCKKGNITPVFQKSKKENSGNYKPVSLASIPGRVVEQILMETVFKYIVDKMIKSCQHGYKQGKSYLTNLVAFCDEAAGFADEGRVVHVVYLDFGKAFNIVSHNIHIDKLMKYRLDK